MVSPLAQSDHKRSPGRTGVVLDLALSMDNMTGDEGGAHCVQRIAGVKSYFSFSEMSSETIECFAPPQSRLPGSIKLAALFPQLPQFPRLDARQPG